jgi:hypothetical protein
VRSLYAQPPAALSESSRGETQDARATDSRNEKIGILVQVTAGAPLHASSPSATRASAGFGFEHRGGLPAQRRPASSTEGASVRRHPSAHCGTAAAPGHVNSVTKLSLSRVPRKQREPRVWMRENRHSLGARTRAGRLGAYLQSTAGLIDISVFSKSRYGVTLSRNNARRLRCERRRRRSPTGGIYRDPAAFDVLNRRGAM